MNFSLTLINPHLCPYVQRVAIALTEKQVPFNRVYVDLSAMKGTGTASACWAVLRERGGLFLLDVH